MRSVHLRHSLRHFSPPSSSIAFFRRSKRCG